MVFYVHFPDKLLSDGAFVAEKQRNVALLKKIYRFPMDWLEETTTGMSRALTPLVRVADKLADQADILLANSKFTAGVFNTFFSISRCPRVVYPGINISAYAAPNDMTVEGIPEVISYASLFSAQNVISDEG